MRLLFVSFLPVVPLPVLSHFVPTVRLEGTLIALFQIGWPGHLHGETEELKGLEEGAVPGTRVLNLVGPPPPVHLKEEPPHVLQPLDRVGLVLGQQRRVALGVEVVKTEAPKENVTQQPD